MRSTVAEMVAEGMRAYDRAAGASANDNQAGASATAADVAGEEQFSGIDWHSLEGREAPERAFVVEDWLPVGCTTSLYGAGGVGKSFLAQLLGSAVAAGRPFLGLRTTRAPVLAVFCEDDDAELWRRQERINRALGMGMGDLGGFAAQGRLGMSNLLMVFPKGKPPEPQALTRVIEGAARAIGAKLIILDNIAQLFGGEENARAEVTAFVNLQNGLARRLDAAVLLLGHPPKNGAEFSGSTAWQAAARCMWTLAAVVEQGEDGDTGGSLLLTRFKANYVPTGAQVRLRWVDGVLRPDAGTAGMSALDLLQRREGAKAAFLDTLDALTAQRRGVSHSDRAANYAPKFIKTAGLAEGWTKKELERAMHDLLNDGLIIASSSLWRGADRKWVFGLARRPVEGREPQQAGHPGSDCGSHTSGTTEGQRAVGLA
jgi:RecA-family ATPase